MSLTILLGFLTSIIFFTLARKRLSLSVLYLAFLLPLDNPIYFAWGHSQATPIRWALAGIFLYIIYSFFANKTYKSYKDGLLKALTNAVNRDIFLFILLFIWFIRLISFSVSLNISSSINYQAFFTEIILIYLLIKKCVEKEGKAFIISFIRNYVLAGLLVSLISPYQYYMYKFQDRILPGVWPLKDRPVRIGSLFWDINHFAAYLATVIPFIPYLIIKAEKIKLKLFYILVFIITLMSFGMTLSRSGFIGLAVGFIVFLVLLALKGYVKQSFIILLTILVLSFGSVYIADKFGLNLSYQLQKRFLSINFSYRVWDDSINAHSALAYGSWQIMEQNPIFGGGYGSFNEQFRKTEVSKTYFELDPVKDSVIPPHSLWFEPLSATGFLGSAPFYIFFFLIFYVLFVRYKKSQKSKEITLNIGFIASLVAVSLAGFFYSYNLEFFYIFVFLALFYGAFAVKKLPLECVEVLALTFITVFSGLFIFYKLDATTLIDWDEAIYAKIAKNILNGIGDPLNLVWQIAKGSWFEKPPLFIWLTSLSFQLFGVNEFSARFISAIAGFISSIVLYLFGKILFRSKTAALLSSIVLATTVHYIFQSRSGTMDVLTSLFILCSMFSFWYSRERKREWWLLGVFLGLTLMTKSVVVVIPILSLVLFVLYDLFVLKNRNYSIRNILSIMLWFLIVGLPWHIIEYIRFGSEFFNSYVLYHILERSKGVEGHSNDFWWYLVVIKVWFRHWAVVAIPALLASIGFLTRRVGKYSASLAFLLIWIFVTFFIFSLSVSKIQWYIIPIYPALALLVGWFLYKLFNLVISYKKSFKIFLVPYVLLILVVSSFLVIIWSNMWILDDYNRGLKDIGMMIAENRDRYEFIPRVVPVYIYDLPPAPPLFYTLRYAKVIGKTEIVDMFKSPDGKAFMAISSKGSYESLKLKYNNPRVMVYAESKGFVLFGKDWKDVRDKFSQQSYETPYDIYDPYYFCEWVEFGGNRLCN